MNEQESADVAAIVNPNQNLIDGLRDLAKFIETHPDLPTCHGTPTVSYWFYSWSIDKRTPQSISQICGETDSKIEKEYFVMSRSFGPVTMRFTWQACDVCIQATELVEIKKWSYPDLSAGDKRMGIAGTAEGDAPVLQEKNHE